MIILQRLFLVAALAGSTSAQADRDDWRWEDRDDGFRRGGFSWGGFYVSPPVVQVPGVVIAPPRYAYGPPPPPPPPVYYNPGWGYPRYGDPYVRDWDGDGD